MEGLDVLDPHVELRAGRAFNLNMYDNLLRYPDPPQLAPWLAARKDTIGSRMDEACARLTDNA